MDPSDPSERIAILARRWQEGSITDAERAEFELWYADFDDTLEIHTHESVEEAERRIYEQIAIKGNLRSGQRFKWFPYASVAAVLCFLAAGLALYTVNQHSPQPTLAYHSDVSPGGHKAVLTLSNGERIELGAAKNGRLAVQGSSLITKTAAGMISYMGTGNAPAGKSALMYNMVSTPAGGEYQLTLADGTRVWLNATSSIRFPAIFHGAERKVEITGEAYFEVAHNADKPFRVQSSRQEVEVLGTHFNVNAYGGGQETTTTLLEGSVRVSSALGKTLIKPGQQSVLTGNRITTGRADLEGAVAWKNGYFRFNENLEGIMNKIARWYDVSIVYQSIPDTTYTFEGQISRTRRLSEILKIMEYTGKVHFAIEGRRVIVNK